MTAAQGQTSWDLVAAAQGGDADAFGELWRRYQADVAHYIASRVHNRAITEDLTSETFIRAWRAINTVQDQGRDVGAWLNRIARNITIDHAKSAHSTRSAPVAEFDFSFNLPTTAGPEATVPEQRRSDATARRLDWMIQRLSPAQQEVVRHRFYGGLSVNEVAARTGNTVPAVKAVQHRAIRTLALACCPARSSVEFVDTSPEWGDLR